MTAVASMSKAEQAFWDACILDPQGGLHGLTSGWGVVVDGRTYRIDFALPDCFIGIEIDGLAYHNGQTSFMHDRRRQRELEMQGWRIIRFAALEVLTNPAGCVREASALVARFTWSRA